MQVRTHYFPSAQLDPAELPAELDSPSTLVLVFSGLPAGVVGAVLPTLRAAFPTAVITGCSTAGEVIGSDVRDGGVCVGVARFERTRLTVADAPLPDAGASETAGAELTRRLRDPSLSGLLLYCDGLAVNGSRLLRGVNAELPEAVVVTGGLAGDGDRFRETWVIVDDRPVAGRVVGVGLHGDAVLLGHGYGGGWEPFGPQRLITRSDGNVLAELDGRTALDLYELYLGDLFGGMPLTGLMFPLAIAQSPGHPSMVRAVLAVDQQARTMAFAGDVPQGWTGQLTRPDPDKVVDAAAEAATAAASGATEDGACLAVVVSCVARRLVLKERTEEELEAVVGVLPPGAATVGFYSYGEIAPLPAGRSDLHNQTMTLTTIQERRG